MIRVGDKVALFFDMTKKGIVTKLHLQESNQWMVGGTMSAIFLVTVKLDEDSSEMEFRADQLMRLD
jgi:hypothetical protein